MPSSRQEHVAIERAKNVRLSTLDRNLAKVTLDAFLKSVAGSAPIQWEVNDCGEQTGNPEVDRERDFPICAEAIFTLADGRTVNVSLSVGSVRRGVSGKPELAYVMVTEKNGAVRNLRLSDLIAHIGK